MSTQQLLVVLGGVAAIALVNWYYFAPRGAVAATVAGDGAQSIRITVLGGYTPQTVRVKRGRPVRLVFDRRETSPCSEEVVIGEFGIRQFLAPHAETAVEITPTRSGKFEITCGMSMLHGSLVVED